MTCQHTYLIQNCQKLVFFSTLQTYCLFTAVTFKIMNKFKHNNKALFHYNGYVLIEATDWHKVSPKKLVFSILVELSLHLQVSTN